MQSPKEILTKIISSRITNYLLEEGFIFNQSKLHYTRTVNKIKQFIYFEGNKYNYAGGIADYKLVCRLEIKEFPKWYLSNYETEQATHHQGTISPKTTGQPSPSKSYRDNWNEYGQVNHKYDLIKFSKEEIEENILENLKNCIVPYLNDCSKYSGIAEKAIQPLDSFDYYMMDNKTKEAKRIIVELIKKVEDLKIEELNLTDKFTVDSIQNTINMLNIRIKKFFPEIEIIEIDLNQKRA